MRQTPYEADGKSVVISYLARRLTKRRAHAIFSIRPEYADLYRAVSVYTEDDYRTMFELRGFQVDRAVGIGTPAVYQVDTGLRATPNEFEDRIALPVPKAIKAGRAL
jgi:hypothetical protein